MNEVERELEKLVFNDKSQRVTPCPYCKSKYSAGAAKGVRVFTKEIMYEGKRQLGYYVGCDLCQSRGPLMASGAAAIYFWSVVTRRAKYGPETN